MSTVARPQFEAILQNNELRSYLESKNVRAEEFQKFLDAGMIEVMAQSVDMSELIQEATEKGIVYNDMSKRELIQVLWNNTETTEVDTAKLKRIKTRNCNKKRRARQTAVAKLSEARR